MYQPHRFIARLSGAAVALALVSGSVGAGDAGGPTIKLLEAVLDGDLQKAQAMVAAGAQVGVVSGQPLLGLAAGLNEKDARDEARKQDRLAIVELLLKANANPDARGTAGRTALMRTAGLGRADMVKALIAAKADVGARDDQGCSAMHDAAAKGHREIIQVLIEAKAAVSPICEIGTPLMRAAGAGHLDAVKALLAAKASTEARDKDGTTALMLAAYSGSRDVVDALVAANAKVNAQDNRGASALRWAVVEEDKQDIVGLLIRANADVNLVDNQGNSPLHRAVARGNTNAVRALIAANAKLDARNDDGSTPLMQAVIMGHREVMDSLLSAGAEINAKDNTGHSALLFAAQGSDEASKVMLQMLLKASARWPDFPAERFQVAAALDDVAQVKALIAGKLDVNGRIGTKVQLGENKEPLPTPLIVAARVGAVKTTGALLAAKANVNAAVREGATAIFAAVLSGSREIVKMLLEAGANPHVRLGLDTFKGATLLHLVAIAGKSDDIARLLIAAKVDVNAKAKMNEEDGVTALMLAAGMGNKKLVSSLLEANADVNAQDKGFTALHSASKSVTANSREIAAALIAAKADVNARDADGKTPLALALLNDNKEVADLLRQAGAAE